MPATGWRSRFPPDDPALSNAWPPALEAEFRQRAEQAIAHYADTDYGNTHSENEKRSYAIAMLDFLAGNRDRALNFLQAEDVEAEVHAHTEGIDYYYSFTLKHQIRKYFLLGAELDPDYRQRMYAGAKAWTAEDPNRRPHPVYGMGDGSGSDWDIRRRGRWVDSRNTDNLRAMREVAVYLMAEETGNEATRQLYKQKLQRYVWALYHIGMGEWDSETYHGHTFAPYLNLYDFARDPEVKAIAKAALDWLSVSAAVKYYRGGWAGPVKRDKGSSNVVYGAPAARFFWLYFGDTVQPNPRPERDVLHAITSRYRPPLAAVALARRQFERPVEILATKPVYENWKPDADEQPGYWETQYFGQTYQLGSVASPRPDGDVGPFKLLATNTARGVDYFIANTGEPLNSRGKHPGDQIGQFENLAIWLRPGDGRLFGFQIPQTAVAEIVDGIWFFRLEQTWLAVRPINLAAYQSVPWPDHGYARGYEAEQALQAAMTAGSYAGFALEVGEPATHETYENFKRQVRRAGGAGSESTGGRDGDAAR
ncbi:MAG: hypothetical protein HC838_10380, partial [Spirulinaceae cyanobacterium RM2_2_10]|nr:hypothetical protein [Spirulinaceae cyanobacterium RM2_2_10]